MWDRSSVAGEAADGEAGKGLERVGCSERACSRQRLSCRSTVHHRWLLRRRRSLAGLLAVAGVAATCWSVGAAPAAAEPGRSSGPPAVGGEPDRDVLVSSRGDTSGFHLFLAQERSGWAWRPLASLQPGGNEGDDWLGAHCVTGSGRWVVAVIQQRWATNRQDLRDRGALTYAVEVKSGRVFPLTSSVALKAHTPGCGTGNEVALSRNHGLDQAETELISIDLEKRRVDRQVRLPGQYTHAVPLAGGFAAIRGGAVAWIDRQGSLASLQELGGAPFAMMASGDDSVHVAMATSPDQAAVERVTKDGTRRLARGRLDRLKLFKGRAKMNVVSGSDDPVVGNGLIAAPPAAKVDQVGLDGRAAVDEVNAAADPGNQRPIVTKTGSPGGLALPESEAEPVTDLPGLVPFTPPGQRFVGSPSMVQASSSPPSNVPPKCAVPRNDPRRQVPQPNKDQVNWAIQQATRNLLKGGVLTRPSNYLNSQLPSYQPSVDFVRRDLNGAPGVPVPPSVIQAVFAQESNWRHASPRALPGVSGNPNVGDYYGAGGTLDRIDYANADCGYGIGQITDPMTMTSNAYSINGKAKVAIDYAENVTAGIQFLVDKWNQLYTAGITLNNKRPEYLENWYFAVWAYNTGVQPADASCVPSPTCTDPEGRWGLGWTNNPMNGDYPVNRSPFLRYSYGDAAKPWLWPYQEKVFGWMETPLLDYKGRESYGRPFGSALVKLPGRATFCTSANACDPAWHDPTSTIRRDRPGDDVADSLDYCTLSSRRCWWHDHVNFTPCPDQCATSNFTVASNAVEPPYEQNHLPRCAADLPVNLGQDGGRPTIVIDDEPLGLNTRGCAPSAITRGGTFAYQAGSAADGAPLGIIDSHQLGVGLGGRTLFTKNRPATDIAHINTGTWTPPTLNGVYNVKAHVPSTGASSAGVKYTIHLGNGTTIDRSVNQHIHENRWVGLGNFPLGAGAKVVLTNVSVEPQAGSANVAFDALAFTPVVGQPVSNTFDALSIFRHNQNLDGPDDWFTDAIVSTPLRSMQTLYDWANDLTDRANSLESCAPPILSPPSCLPSATKAAFQEWGQRVDSAGTSTSGSETPAKWMHLSQADPPSLISPAFLENIDNFKQHNSVTVDFLVVNGVIDPGSISVTSTFRSSNTHLPDFVMDTMKAVSTEFNVPPPDLRYKARDLITYSHQDSSIDAYADGVVPGREFVSRVSDPVVASNSCVSLLAVGGGMIGYKPMLLQESLRVEVTDWKDRILARYDSGNGPVPRVVRDWAIDIWNIYFRSWDRLPPDMSVGSPFWYSPPIWIHQNYQVCPNGSIRPPMNDTRVADSSYMPSLYLYSNGQQVGFDGQPSLEPAQNGDFGSFSHTGFAALSGWNACDTDPASPTFRGRRDGNPWRPSLSFTDPGAIPTGARFCIGSQESVPGTPHDD